MADEILTPVVTFLLLAGLFAWVPVTAFCNDRCRRLLAKRMAHRRRMGVEPRATSDWAHD